MRFHNRSKEKKDKKEVVFFLKAAVIGMVIAAILIVSGIGLKFFFKFLIKYWVYAIVGVVGFVFVKNYFKRQRKK